MTLEETKEAARTAFLGAKQRLESGLATTPDDRVDWSPAPTARTPIGLVAHAANSVGHMLGNLEGRTHSVPTTEETERQFREREKSVTSREQALELLETNAAAYLLWLDALTEEALATDVQMPFGLGSVPMPVAIGFMPLHVTWHAAQLDYLQTAYGDLDWHLPVVKQSV